METFWTFVVIITGSITVSDDSSIPGFIGGNVENTSYMFFETEEGCAKAREIMLVSAPKIVVGLSDGKVEIGKCNQIDLARE